MTERTEMTDSKERVAFDLMSQIAYHEKTPQPDQVREYYLTLFRECLRVVYGHSPKKTD